MPSRVILFSGASAVGKTAAVKALLPLLNIAQCCVCKIDCLRTQDDEVYRRMGVPCVAGLSRDICPDHFLVSNLPELWQWADAQNRPTLLLETAGLCHRCSPATREMIGRVRGSTAPSAAARRSSSARCSPRRISSC